MSEVCGWVCVGVWFRRKHIKMSLHNLWLRRLLSSSHFRDPLPTPADMLNIEWGQNFCLEPLLSLSTSNTSMCAQAPPSSHCRTRVCVLADARAWARTLMLKTPMLVPVALSYRLMIKRTPSEGARRFGSRMKAAHSFQLHFCQVTYMVLSLLGQSFSNSLIQNNLILALQRGDPSPVSVTWLDPPYCYCVTPFDLVLFLTLYQQSCRRERWNSLWQLIVLLICNVNSGYYISDRY